MSPPLKCPTCEKGFPNNCLRLKCANCLQLFHGPCVGMSKTDIACLTAEKKEWKCSACWKDNDAVHDKADECSDLSSELRKIVIDLFREFQEEWRNDLSSVLDKWSKQVDACVADCELISKEFSVLKKTQNELAQRVADLEQAQRRNDIEIQGVPEEKNENLEEVVINIGQAIKHPICASDIEDVFRVKTRPSEGSMSRPRPGRIIVRMRSPRNRDDFLKAARAKRGLSTKQIGWLKSEECPVYVNASLTPERRRLLMMAKNFKKEKGFKYCWLKDGCVLLRKTDGSAVINIKSECDLNIL